MPFRLFRSKPEPSAPAAEAPRSDPLAAIVQRLPDPLMVISADARRIVLANAAAREVFRLSGEAPMLVTAIRRPELLEIVDAGLSSGEAGEAVFELDERVLHAFVRPLERTAEEPARVLLTVRDETDARRNERMRADFLANASHELRTPLASMAGFIETLRGHARDDAEAQDRFLGIMAAQAERMGRLIADLMSLSRIELNEHVPPDGRADLTGVVVDVVDAVAPLAQATKVRVRLIAHGDAPFQNPSPFGGSVAKPEASDVGGAYGTALTTPIDPPRSLSSGRPLAGPGGVRATSPILGEEHMRSPALEGKGLYFDLTSPGGPIVVPGDRDQLVQVVQNMVDNALKYSPTGGVVGIEIASGLTAEAAIEPRDPAAARLSLLTPAHAPQALYVAVRVTDQGPGIEREHLPRLTERFYRAPGQKSGERSGTGLGLAIVKHILNRHRGGLAVESAPGRGASFVAYLPMAGD